MRRSLVLFDPVAGLEQRILAGVFLDALLAVQGSLSAADELDLVAGEIAVATGGTQCSQQGEVRRPRDTARVADGAASGDPPGLRFNVDRCGGEAEDLGFDELSFDGTFQLALGKSGSADWAGERNAENTVATDGKGRFELLSVLNRHPRQVQAEAIIGTERCAGFQRRGGRRRGGWSSRGTGNRHGAANRNFRFRRRCIGGKGRLRKCQSGMNDGSSGEKEQGAHRRGGSLFLVVVLIDGAGSLLLRFTICRCGHRSRFL